MKKYFLIISAFLISLPSWVFAKTVGEYITDIAKWIAGSVIPILIIIAVIIFIIGVIRFVMLAGNEQERASGRLFIIRGLIGLFVILAIWGILAVFGNTLGISSLGIPRLRQDNDINLVTVPSSPYSSYPIDLPVLYPQ